MRFKQGLLIALVLAGGHAVAALPGVDWAQVADEAPWGIRSGPTAVEFDGKLWLMGGGYKIGEEARVSSSEVWNTTNGTNWTLVTATPGWSPRNNHTSVVFNDRIWVIGGDTGVVDGGFSNQVWSSPDGLNWTQHANAPWTGRFAHQTEVLNDMLVVTGGTYYDGVNNIFFNDVWTSPDGENWTERPEAPFAGRFASSSAVLGDTLYLIGGSYVENGTTHLFNDVWKTTDTLTWDLVTANAPFSPRGGNRSVVYDNEIWVVGGTYFNPGELFANDVWVSPDGLEWTQLTDDAGWVGRRFPALQVFDNKVFILGGVTRFGDDPDYTYLNDVWFTPPPTAVSNRWNSY